MTTKRWLQLCTLGLIWGTSFVWIKLAVSEISPGVLVSLRTLFGALALLVVFITNRSIRSELHLNLRMVGVFAVLGLFNMALPFWLISWSSQYINSGLVSILNSTSPLFTMLIAPLFLKEERLSITQLSGLIIGFVGVVILFIPEISKGGDESILGLGAVLLAGLSYGGMGVFARLKAGGLHPFTQAFFQVLMATVIMWTFTLSFGGPLTFPHTTLTWIALLWLGLLGSCAAYMLYFTLNESVGPTRTAVVSYILPLAGVLLGGIFLGERLHWQSLFGGLLIVAGIAGTNIKQWPLRRAATSN
jgi:drug/metabolite transporter (DMT)-like permease